MRVHIYVKRQQTFRLVSPSKSLAIPAFRFAYLLHPEEFHEELLFLYENIVGGANSVDLAFARRAMKVLRTKRSNLVLTDYLKSAYSSLVRSGIIKTAITPDCGYFVFGIPSDPR